MYYSLFMLNDNLFSLENLEKIIIKTFDKNVLLSRYNASI